MSAPLKTIAGQGDIAATLAGIGRDARAAVRTLALASTAQKDRALELMAKAVRVHSARILAANAEDMTEARSGKMADAYLDRLKLDVARVEAIAAGIDAVRALKDPVGAVTESWTRPNGMRIERVRVPLGVIGIIYESRPNVTADAGALCLKSGNAAVLRGGSDSLRSSRAIVAALGEGLREAGLPEAAIQLIPTRDRAAVGLMLSGLDGNIDVIVPRGGKSLVARVQAEARVPKVTLRVIDVSFDAIRDPKERTYFMDLPTSFSLPAEAVDRLREIAGRLLRQSPEYEKLLVAAFGKLDPELLKEARKIKDLPNGALPIEKVDNPFFDLKLDYVQESRGVVGVLMCDAILRSQEGDHDDAAAHGNRIPQQARAGPQLVRHAYHERQPCVGWAFQFPFVRWQVTDLAEPKRFTPTQRCSSWRKSLSGSLAIH